MRARLESRSGEGKLSYNARENPAVMDHKDKANYWQQSGKGHRVTEWSPHNYQLCDLRTQEKQFSQNGQ